MGKKWKVKKGKKKGKNGWKKTEATKKEKKKENKRNTNVKGKPICFHMFRRPKVCWIFLGSTSTWYTPICLPERTFRTNVPVEKGFPQQTFWISPFRRKIASNWPPLKGAAAWLCNTGWAASGHSGTLRALCGKWPGVLGGVLLDCPKLGNWFGYPIFRERALYKNHQTSSIKWGAI